MDVVGQIKLVILLSIGSQFTNCPSCAVCVDLVKCQRSRGGLTAARTSSADTYESFGIVRDGRGNGPSRPWCFIVRINVIP